MRLLKKLFDKKRGTSSQPLKNGDTYSISKKRISKNAQFVIHQLHAANYEAYIVGGGVRDILLGRRPKDFDIATNAAPTQIKRVFKNSRLIGRRFQIAHIYFHREVIEVTTFRRGLGRKHKQHKNDLGIIVHDNEFGTLAEDAWRRDFTINALYYDPDNQLLIDETNGLRDLQKQTLRIIGQATKRYQEDPIRMLRAIRISAKLGFTIEAKTAKPFLKQKYLLKHVPPARLYDEIIKLFFTGHAFASYQQLEKYQFLSLLFPSSQHHQNHETYQQFLTLALQKTDQRLSQGKTINPAFLFAVIMWQDYRTIVAEYKKQPKQLNLRASAAQATIKNQLQYCAIPRRVTAMIEEIWQLQHLLTQRRGLRAFNLAQQKRFRAGYDFLLLRSEYEPKLKTLANWWTDFQKVNDEQKQEMVNALPIPKRRQHHKKRKQ